MKWIKKWLKALKKKFKYYTDAEVLLNLAVIRKRIRIAKRIAKKMKPVKLNCHPFLGPWWGSNTQRSVAVDLEFPPSTINIRSSPRTRDRLVHLVGKLKHKRPNALTTIVLQVEDKTIVEEISSGQRQNAPKDQA